MPIVSPYILDTTYFQDGQPQDSILPVAFRAMIDSLAGIAASQQGGTSYTAALPDAGTCVEMTSATPCSFVLAPNSSVNFPLGTVIEVCQIGAGQVTLVPGAGVTIDTAATLTTRAQYSTVCVRQRNTNEWAATGDLT